MSVRAWEGDSSSGQESSGALVAVQFSEVQVSEVSGGADSKGRGAVRRRGV